MATRGQFRAENSGHMRVIAVFARDFRTAKADQRSGRACRPRRLVAQ
jgi:hypothetical protein